MSNMPIAPAATAGAALVDTASHAGKYLTLFLGSEEYGVDVMKVQEIIQILPITRVPHAPEFIRGVMNLRGRIVPVIDLRRRMHMSPAPDARETCIVVVRTRELLMGLTVDQVRDVVDMTAPEIEDVPDFGTAVDTRYLAGVARRDARVVLLLDVERVLCREETDVLGDVARSATVST